MYIDTQEGEVDFQPPLEGVDSIALREVCYVVGYYNISREKGNNTVHYTNAEGRFSSTVPDGLYSLKAYEKALHGIMGKGLIVDSLQSSGRVSVGVARGTSLKAFTDIHGILGLTPGVIVKPGDTVVGEDTVKLLSPKQLFIHCKQVNREANLYNGKPSDILEVSPVTATQFGFMVRHRFLSPSFKRLSCGALHKLSLEIKDEMGDAVNFHGRYIRYTLVLRNECVRT